MTPERRKEIQKQYREKNVDKIKAAREANKEVLAIKKKIYNETHKEQRKLHDQHNREKINEKKRVWNAANYEKIKPKKKELHNIYYANNTEMLLNKQKIYYEKNKDMIRERGRLYRQRRKEVDPLYKLASSIRVRICHTFTNNGYTKKSSTFEILGCTFEELKKHLESQFEDWMNWNNKGLYKKGMYNYGWDIDHIIPLNTAITVEDIVRLNHYTNLQPLCSKVNRDIKRNKLLFPKSSDKI